MKKLSVIIFIIMIIAVITPLSNIVKMYPILFEDSQKASSKESSYRIVVVSAHLGDSYWDEIIESIQLEAKNYPLHLDIKGSFRSNSEEIEKVIDVAIASNVDGILLVGLDDEHFVSIINKATINGIPVITVGADLPASLRKTYIGTNHYQSGVYVASIIKKLHHPSEKIGVIRGDQASIIQEERLNGLIEKLSTTKHQIYQYQSKRQYPTIEAQTNGLLNQYPDMKIFITMGINTEDKAIKAIMERYSLDGITIYSFDDTKRTRNLLQKNFIDGVLHHSKEEMGRLSIQYLMQWLNKENLPLPNHIYTDIELLVGRKEL